MKHFNKILCPYDRSAAADEALRYAIKLADTDTLITLVQVIQLPYLIAPDGFAYFEVDEENINKSETEALKKKIDAVIQDHPNLKIDYRTIIENDPAQYILKLQQQENYELIVMGSHGRKGLTRILVGSVTESVMRDAKCPVLVIKEGNA